MLMLGRVGTVLPSRNMFVVLAVSLDFGDLTRTIAVPSPEKLDRLPR
jgi:hypothetical protein